MAELMDESIQVSSTSDSPLKSFEPHFGQWVNDGPWVLGSTGNSLSLGVITWLHFVQCQSGMGVAKTRCLEITQSQSRESAQSNRRCLANDGTHCSLSDHWAIWSFIWRVFMNHCGREIISTGVLQRQHTPMFCVMGWVFRIFFSASSFSRIFFLASSILSPLNSPA